MANGGYGLIHPRATDGLPGETGDQSDFRKTAVAAVHGAVQLLLSPDGVVLDRAASSAHIGFVGAVPNEKALAAPAAGVGSGRGGRPRRQ